MVKGNIRLLSLDSNKKLIEAQDDLKRYVYLSLFNRLINYTPSNSSIFKGLKSIQRYDDLLTGKFKL